MQVKTTIHLSEDEIKVILKDYLKSQGFKVLDATIFGRGMEGDIQIPKGSKGDCVGFEAEVLQKKQKNG